MSGPPFSQPITMYLALRMAVGHAQGSIPPDEATDLVTLDQFKIMLQLFGPFADDQQNCVEKILTSLVDREALAGLWGPPHFPIFESTSPRIAIVPWFWHDPSNETRDNLIYKEMRKRMNIPYRYVGIPIKCNQHYMNHNEPPNYEFWYGIISHVHETSAKNAGGLYDIKYYDGDREERVPSSRIVCSDCHFAVQIRLSAASASNATFTICSTKHRYLHGQSNILEPSDEQRKYRIKKIKVWNASQSGYKIEVGQKGNYAYFHDLQSVLEHQQLLPEINDAHLDKDSRKSLPIQSPGYTWITNFVNMQCEKHRAKLMEDLVVPCFEPRVTTAYLPQLSAICIESTEVQKRLDEVVTAVYGEATSKRNSDDGFLQRQVVILLPEEIVADMASRTRLESGLQALRQRNFSDAIFHFKRAENGTRGDPKRRKAFAVALALLAEPYRLAALDPNYIVGAKHLRDDNDHLIPHPLLLPRAIELIRKALEWVRSLSADDRAHLIKPVRHSPYIASPGTPNVNELEYRLSGLNLCCMVTHLQMASEEGKDRETGLEKALKRTATRESLLRGSIMKATLARRSSSVDQRDLNSSFRESMGMISDEEEMRAMRKEEAKRHAVEYILFCVAWEEGCVDCSVEGVSKDAELREQQQHAFSKVLSPRILREVSNFGRKLASLASKLPKTEIFRTASFYRFAAAASRIADAYPSFFEGRMLYNAGIFTQRLHKTFEVKVSFARMCFAQDKICNESLLTNPQPPAPLPLSLHCRFLGRIVKSHWALI